MNNFLFVDEEDMSFLWNTIQEQQVILHPSIAPDGRFDYSKFFASKGKKPFILFLDRNILSSLLKLCERGSLKCKEEARLIALIMAWAQLNDISISAGLAVKERAYQLHSQEEGLIELQKFLEVFDAYPGQMWLYVAEGCMTEIPQIAFSGKPAENITVDYTDCGDHYEMALASLLHAIGLYRNNSLKPVEKIHQFFDWMCDHLLISEYLLVYITMLFTGQENIKAPKHANSNEFEKIVSGCENQAWDIAYLTNWSTLYANTEKCDEEFLFATNDVLLKRIFINKNGPHGLNGLLFEVLTKKEYNEFLDFAEEKMKNRIKPDFDNDSHAYLYKLIEQEKKTLQELLCKERK